MKKEILGHLFNVDIVRDEDIRFPWKTNDGHGPVSEWTTRRKGPGERVLLSEDGRQLLYDWNGALEKAVTDCWGISDDEKAQLTHVLGRAPKKREVYARAVELDYQRLLAWCKDEWWYVGVAVTLLKRDDDAPEGFFPTKYQASLWGIESDAGSYLDEVAQQLADEVLSDYVSTKPKVQPC